MDIIETKHANGKKSFQYNKQDYLYLMLILVNQFAYGMSTEVLNATEADLGFIYGVVSLDNLFVPIYVAFLIGSLGNFVHRWINRQLMLVFAILLAAITYSLIPQCDQLWKAYFVMILNGIGSGVWKCASLVWLIQIMPNRISIVLQASQFMFNLGSTLGPLLAKPFALGEALVDDRNQTLSVAVRQRAMTIPYLIVSQIQAMIAVLFMVLYLTNPYEYDHHNSKLSQIKKHQIVIPYRRHKMLLCGLTIAIYYTAEIAFLNYSSQLLKEIGHSDGEVFGAYVDLTILNLVGPLVTMCISMIIQPQNVILYHYAIVIPAFLLLYFGCHTQTLVLVSNAFLGLGLSPLLPAMLVFIEMHLQLNERDTSLYTFMFGVVLLVTPFVRRAAFTNSPMILFAYEAVLLPLSLALFLLAKFWIFHHQDSQEK